MQNKLQCRNNCFPVAVGTPVAVAPYLNLPKPLPPHSRKPKLKLELKKLNHFLNCLSFSSSYLRFRCLASL